MRITGDPMFVSVDAHSSFDISPLIGRRLLITGGTGAFGQAFARRALADGAEWVALLSRGEARQAAMRAVFDDPRLRFFIGDVRDRLRIRQACRGVDFVVHAAALKRIEVCEIDPFEAIATNIHGTENVLAGCMDAGVERAVFLSTDKAANPATLYGATKLAAERLWTQGNVHAAGTRTRFSATRYGNVLGSTGSVVEVWKRQKAAGEPLTLTDPSATRFWMTMEDAVALVIRAFHEMRGGEVFVPKIGSAPLLDLARAIAETEGTYQPGHTESPLRRGEKRHETLIGEDEARYAVDHGTHYTIEPAVTWEPVDPTPRAGIWVPFGFTYRSDTNPDQLTVGELRRMAA